MVSSTLYPAVHILRSQNVYGRAQGIADHYWPLAVFFLFSAPRPTREAFPAGLEALLDGSKALQAGF